MSADLLEQLSNQIRDRYGDELPFAKTLLELLHWHSAQIIELQKLQLQKGPVIYADGRLMPGIPLPPQSTLDMVNCEYDENGILKTPVDNVDTSA